jgi:hypothetical protein
VLACGPPSSKATVTTAESNLYGRRLPAMRAAEERINDGIGNLSFRLLAEHIQATLHRGVNPLPHCPAERRFGLRIQLADSGPR